MRQRQLAGLGIYSQKSTDEYAFDLLLERAIEQIDRQNRVFHPLSALDGADATDAFFLFWRRLDGTPFIDCAIPERQLLHLGRAVGQQSGKHPAMALRLEPHL